jgi:hypothetical protein
MDVEVKRFLIGMKNVTIDDEGTKFPKVPFATPFVDRVVSCKQIWDWVKGSIFFFARERMRPESFQSNFPDTTSGTPWQVVYDDVRRWLQGAPPGGNPAELDPQKVLAAFIYKNVLTEASHSALQVQVFGRSPFNAKQYETVFGDLSDAEAHGGFFKLRYFATAIPYIQGLLLYLLTISFSFFAIFLVLPGRATSIFVWCSLWVWVKSWDIGFALVFVARDIFWHFFNNRVNVFQQKIDWDFPTDVINVAFNNVPLLHENAFWVIISGLTVSVPVLTAHCCMGATGMFDMLKGSIDQTANRFRPIQANVGRRSIANKLEDLMRKQNYFMPKIYADATARQQQRGNTPLGGQTGLGDPLITRNWQSPQGLLSEGTKGVEGGHYSVGSAYMMGQFFNQHSDPALRDTVATIPGPLDHAALAL